MLSGSAAGPSIRGRAWHIKGTGDFNGDGKSDILWQNDDGTPAIWLMNGIDHAGRQRRRSANPGPSWQVKGTGDFNGDGKSDILWQGDDGTPAIWTMDGTHVCRWVLPALQSWGGLARHLAYVPAAPFPWLLCARRPTRGERQRHGSGTQLMEAI